jgi:hypothetical protein
MLIQRVSTLTGNYHEQEIPITERQWENYLNGMLIQYAMPNLTPEQREFIISGSTAEEWKLLEEIEDRNTGMESQI